MLHALRIELMKWRRTALLWVTAAAALTTPLLTFLVFANRTETPVWQELFTQSLMMHGMMIGPLIVTLVGAQMIATEYQSDTWKLSFTAPLRRGQVYLAKVLLGLLWVVGISGLVFLGAMVAGLLLTASPLTDGAVWAFRYLVTGAGLFTMLPLYHLVTLLSRSFFVTSGVGIVATFTGIIVVNSRYAGVYPVSSVLILINKWFGLHLGTGELVGSDPLWMGVLAATLLLPMLLSLVYVRRADLG